MYQGFIGDGWEGSGGRCEGEGVVARVCFPPKHF